MACEGAHSRNVLIILKKSKEIEEVAGSGKGQILESSVGFCVSMGILRGS